MALIILSIFLLIPIILLVTIILISTKKSTELFENKLRTIYCYLILLICIVAVIVSVILFVNNLTEVLIPDIEETNPIYEGNIVKSTDNDTKMNPYYRNLITCAFSILIFVPVGIYHSKKIKK